MTDPLSPPPWRVIPPEVRDRILETTPARRPVVAALAVAAAVAVLAVGAVFILRTPMGQRDFATPPPKPIASEPMDPRLADELLAACFTGRNVFPVLTADYGDSRVLGGYDGDRPVFCEATKTTVAVTSADPGARTSLVLRSSLGTIGGTVDLARQSLWIRTGQVSRPVTMNDGLFITNGAEPGEAIEAGAGSEWTTLPDPASPELRVTHPSAPDRTSERGKELDSCITAASAVQGVVDAASWEPGARVELGSDRVLVTRNAFGYSSCWTIGGRPGFGGFGGFNGYLAESAAASGPGPRRIPGPKPVSGQIVLLGAVPPSSRVEVVISGGPTVTADVHGTTFAALLPPEADGRKVSFRLYGAAGELAYSGGWTP